MGHGCGGCAGAGNFDDPTDLRPNPICVAAAGIGQHVNHSDGHLCGRCGHGGVCYNGHYGPRFACTVSELARALAAVPTCTDAPIAAVSTAPVTSAPVTSAPTSSAPVTLAPSTSEPAIPPTASPTNIPGVTICVEADIAACAVSNQPCVVTLAGPVCVTAAVSVPTASPTLARTCKGSPDPAGCATLAAADCSTHSEMAENCPVLCSTCSCNGERDASICLSFNTAACPVLGNPALCMGLCNTCVAATMTEPTAGPATAMTTTTSTTTETKFADSSEKSSSVDEDEGVPWWLIVIIVLAVLACCLAAYIMCRPRSDAKTTRTGPGIANPVYAPGISGAGDHGGALNNAVYMQAGMPSQGALANPGYAGLEPTGPTYTTLPGDGKGRDIGALGNPSYASSAVGRPGSGMVNPMYGEQPDQPPVYETIPGELAGQDADNARSGGGGYLEVIPTGTPGYASVDDMLAASTGTYGPDISI